MKIFQSRRGRFVAAIFVVLALFVIRPGAGGLKSRISRSISLALGRQVEIGKIRVRVLPRPGFDLQSFMVQDDPGFGAEPFLRADEVSANIRISSLLRGRLDVSSLSLTEPSVNLVRNHEGRWNLETLLERAARIAVAPTAKTRAERRPGFPYIQADRARINLKFEQEKTPYALTDADFSFWQDAENTWAMRLKAQPMRTDFNITDTGVLRISGSWQRSASLRETPLQFSFAWERGQLGQLTKLVSGSDRGWRGTVSLAFDFSGTPEDLSITGSTSIQDFRRYDILTSDSLRLNAHCIAHYSSVERTLHDIICGAPVGDGTLALQGELAGLLRPYTYDLTVSAEELPVQALINLARHAKKDLPQDLIAHGNFNGSVSVQAVNGGAPAIAGDGGITDLRLRSAVTRTELELGSIPLEVTAEAPKSGHLNRTKSSSRDMNGPAPPRLEVGPFVLALGRGSEIAIHGWASPLGYNFAVQGLGEVKHIVQAARTVGLRAAQVPAQGNARLDLQVAGLWSGFAPAEVSGSAQLSDVVAEVRGINMPLQIKSANLKLAENEVEVQNITASIGDSRWQGSVSVPRHCSSVATCPASFDLHTEQLDAKHVSALLNPSEARRPWYHLLSPWTGRPSILAELHASGRLSASRVLWGEMAGKHLSADLDLRDARLHVANLRAEVLGGTHTGDWRVDFSSKPFAYAGNGTFERISLDQVAKFTHDGWISGTARTTYRLTTSGASREDLMSQVAGEGHFEMNNGSLSHISLGSESAPLHVRRFNGRFVVTDGRLQIEEGKLDASGGIYQVSGTASLGQNLNIRVIRDSSHVFGITGTITAPRVVLLSGPETQAALQP